MMKIRFCTPKSDFKADHVRECMLHKIMALKMTISNSSSQVKEWYYSVGDIKSTLHIPNTHYPQAYVMVSFLKNNAESFHQRQTLAQTTNYSVFVCKIVWGSSCRWKGNEAVHC
jgi:hypothetical protein